MAKKDAERKEKPKSKKEKPTEGTTSGDSTFTTVTQSIPGVSAGGKIPSRNTKSR